jgi:oligosaccharide repeat unit polymerase
MKILEQLRKSEILRPSVLLTIGTLIFIALAKYAPSRIGIIVIISCLAAFAFGEKYGLKFKPKLKINKKVLRTTSGIIFLIALVALYFDFYSAGGIPLLNSTTRRFLHPILTSLAFLMVPANAVLVSTLSKEKRAKLQTGFLILFTAGIMALLGYRTEVLAAIISGVLVAYYCEIFEFKEIASFGIAAIIAFVGITVLRGGGLINYRSATTLGAFDFLVEKAGTLGLTHGSVQFADIMKIFSDLPVIGGRHLVGNIIGSRAGVSITSTLFGPPFIDFGILALLEFGILGLIAGAGYIAAKTKKGLYAASHSIVLTFLLLGIETGITDLIIWIYIILAGGFFAYSHLKK